MSSVTNTPINIPIEYIIETIARTILEERFLSCSSLYMVLYRLFFLRYRHIIISNIMDNGLIINVSSTDGIDTYNEVSMDYCASKAAINNLTKTFALAFNNIKVIGVIIIPLAILIFLNNINVII